MVTMAQGRAWHSLIGGLLLACLASMLVACGGGGGGAAAESAQAAPTISSQPNSTGVVLPAAATFSVVAAGSPAPSYQWQRSTNGGAAYANIASATSASYSTPATTLADAGSMYRVSVSNSVGTVTSSAALLTVAAAATAPVISTQPIGATVTVPVAATFNVVATGFPAPTYQWQLSTDAGATFANISGATSTSYTTPATAPTDNGKRFRVVVSNSAGSLSSALAALTVQAGPGAATGGSWSVPQLLESDDNPVSSSFMRIDDAGRSILIFSKRIGAQRVLYTTRGTAGAAGTAPAWSTPVAMNDWGDVSSLAVAPNGNAVALWFGATPCALPGGASGNCVFSARYIAATETWEAPVSFPVLANPPPFSSITTRINNNGDVGVFISDLPSGLALTVAWRANGASSFQQRLLGDNPMQQAAFDMDSTGNMLVAGVVFQNAAFDLVAFRGTMSGGFGPPQTLDTRGSEVFYYLPGLGNSRVAVGPSGQQVVIWSQNNGIRNAYFAATSESPTAPFTITDLGIDPGTNSLAFRLTVSDSGQAIFFPGNGKRVRWTGGTWHAPEQLPQSAPFESCSFVRNGNFMCLPGQSLTNGVWGSYDASRNVMTHPFDSPPSGYVLGYGQGGVGYSIPVLSVSGAAAMVLLNNFDVLPTPAVPAGDSRSTLIINLWGSFLKWP